MKLVLDSNIIIAAFATRGLCGDIFEICLQKHEIVISSFIIKEIRNVFTNKIKLPEKTVKSIISYLEKFCSVIDYKKTEKGACRDSDDDEILSLAVNSGAEYIITGDKDLLVIKKYKTVKIITPRGFWRVEKISGTNTDR